MSGVDVIWNVDHLVVSRVEPVLSQSLQRNQISSIEAFHLLSHPQVCCGKPQPVRQVCDINTPKYL